MNLFNIGNFKLHSGKESNFKIDCDALSYEDIEYLAEIIYKKYSSFWKVYGIPEGGRRLAYALSKYSKTKGDYVLVVDDVLTTGQSMKKTMNRFHGSVWGVVIFARGKCPEFVEPIFQMWK